MSSVSARLEALAETHRVNPLYILEWHCERSAIRQYEGGLSRTQADRLALEDIEAELEGRK
jgi:hypothetical protein